MRSCSLSWKLFWLLPVAAGAQVPDVHFPEVDPLYSYPIPPLGLLGPKCDMDVVDVRYSESGEERQTLHIVVHQLANGVSRVTTTASVHGIPFKRPHHWRRWVHLPERLFIAPKKRLENAYHFKVVGDAYRVCTERGRAKDPGKPTLWRTEGSFGIRSSTGIRSSSSAFMPISLTRPKAASSLRSGQMVDCTDPGSAHEHKVRSRSTWNTLTPIREIRFSSFIGSQHMGRMSVLQ